MLGPHLATRRLSAAPHGPHGVTSTTTSPRAGRHAPRSGGHTAPLDSSRGYIIIITYHNTAHDTNALRRTARRPPLLVTAGTPLAARPMLQHGDPSSEQSRELSADLRGADAALHVDQHAPPPSPRGGEQRLDLAWPGRAASHGAPASHAVTTHVNNLYNMYDMYIICYISASDNWPAARRPPPPPRTACLLHGQQPDLPHGGPATVATLEPATVCGDVTLPRARPGAPLQGPGVSPPTSRPQPPAAECNAAPSSAGPASSAPKGQRPPPPPQN